MERYMIGVMVDENLLSRFQSYLSKEFKVEKVRDNLLFLKTENVALFKKKIEEDYVNRYLTRVFFIDKITNNLCFKNLEKETIRIVGYPKNQEERISEQMLSQGINLSPTVFTKIFYFVMVNGKYYYGIKEKDFFFRKKEQEKHLARAYYKIEEIVETEKLNVKNKTILDIGAAPGGWCEYLKEHAKQIIAIDPANLDIKAENIIHFKEKFEDILLKINNYDYDIIICDINDEFMKVIKYILQLNYKNKQLIMTLKFSRSNQNYIDNQVKEIEQFMKNYSKNIKIKWLFANTKFERTLFCKL